MVRYWRAFLTALGFLTRIPVMPKNSIKTSSLNQSLIFFPLAGGIVGAVSALFYLLLKPFLPGPVLIAIILAIPLFMSGGIHFDGLLDTCDGIFSGRSRERSLAIMRDSRVGSMGVAAGIMDLLLRYSLLTSLAGDIIPGLLVAQAVAGRWVITLAVYFFPYARQEGLGRAFSLDKKYSSVILSSLVMLIIITSIIGAGGSLTALLTGVLSLLAAYRVNAKLGGLTGDVYGALNEVGEILFLMLWLLGSSGRCPIF